MTRTRASAAALLLAFVAMAGCGGGSATTTTVTTVTEPATALVKPGTASPLWGKKPAARSLFTACDPNIKVKTSTTSCAFAQNVFYQYYVSGFADDVRAYSPPRHKTFQVQCGVEFGHVRCATYVGGVVKFPKSAARAYTDTQAAAYAAGHYAGPKPSTSSAPSTPPTQKYVPPAEEYVAPPATEPDNGRCDANYSGCVPAGGGDVNCGDISDTNIQVLGSDVDGLDRDGDGIGCES